jgi:hypothetical protein
MRKFSREHARKGSLLAGLLVVFGLGARNIADDVVRLGARAFNPADDIAKAGGRKLARPLRPGRSLGAGKHRELARSVEVIDRGAPIVNYGLDASAPPSLEVDLSPPRPSKWPGKPLQPLQPSFLPKLSVGDER